MGIEGEHAGHGHFGQAGDVVHRAPAEVVVLEGEVALVLRGAEAAAAIGHRGELVELNLREGDYGIHGGHGGKGFVAEPLQHGPQLVELGRGMARLADGGIVVVAGAVGLIAGAVGACPVAERGAAVHHIEAKGDVLHQHLPQAGHHVLGIARLMGAAPVVEPSAPELRAHQRRRGTQLLQSAELAVDVRARAEVHRPQQVIEGVLLEVAAPVALEEGDVGPAHLAQHVTHGTDVGLVGAVAAELVLHLHHNDGAATGYLQVGKLPRQRGLELAHALHEVRVERAEADVLLFQQPPGQTAHLPLGTAVGPGTDDDVEPVLLAELDKGADVGLPLEAELVGLRLVEVPEDVDAHGVHALRLDHADAVLPVLAGDTGEVHLARLDDERTAVEEERAFADFERLAHRALAADEDEQCCHKQQKGDGVVVFHHRECAEDCFFHVQRCKSRDYIWFFKTFWLTLHA